MKNFLKEKIKKENFTFVKFKDRNLPKNVYEIYINLCSKGIIRCLEVEILNGKVMINPKIKF